MASNLVEWTTPSDLISFSYDVTGERGTLKVASHEDGVAGAPREVSVDSNTACLFIHQTRGGTRSSEGKGIKNIWGNLMPGPGDVTLDYARWDGGEVAVEVHVSMMNYSN